MYLKKLSNSLVVSDNFRIFTLTIKNKTNGRTYTTTNAFIIN